MDITLQSQWQSLLCVKNRNRRHNSMKIFKKTMALFILALSFQTMASAPVNHLNELKAAFDRLNFAVEVQWDQKDKMFYNAKVNEFKKTVEKLQEQGLTNEELIEFVKRNIKDKNVAQDVDKLFETIKTSSMSKAEARKFIIEYVGKNYAQGASWMGSASATILLVGLLIVLAVIATAGTTVIYDDPGYYDYYDCWEEYECYDYYDSYYDYWYTDCDWYEYCY